MTADVVVLGAGLAGLALGAQVARARGPRPRVVLLDPRTSWEDDRTWCWFDRPGGGPQHLVDDVWTRWRVSTHERTVTHDGGNLAAYHRVRASRFHDHALARVDAADHVVLRPGVRATGVHRDPSGLLTVRTDAGELTARAVVDTRPPARERALRSPLLQVFTGVEITTDRPVLAPTTVGLMERLTSDEHGLRFDYVLPTSATTALVEATRFAPGPVPDDVLAADLDRAVAAATTGARAVRRGRAETGA